LAACSSSEVGRAPVVDAKSDETDYGNKAGTYIARGKIVGQDTYIVQPGDTMYSIGWRTGIDVDVLIKRNNLDKPYIIHTGQVLVLEEGASKTSAYSQNDDNSNATDCTDQNCEESKQPEVVKETSKEYYADEEIVKPVALNSSKSSVEVDAWKWPTKGQLTKTFASSTQGMKGISISNIRGTPIYAAASGKVVYAGNGLRGYGNLIIIKHDNDYLSAYAHNEKLLIKENTEVTIGQKIAIMGDSGTDKVHLHFDIRYQGKSVDPLRYLPKR
jgi:lipoprotein NlpD